MGEMESTKFFSSCFNAKLPMEIQNIPEKTCETCAGDGADCRTRTYRDGWNRKCSDQREWKKLESKLDAKRSKKSKDSTIAKAWKELKAKRASSHGIKSLVWNERISTGFDTAGYRPSCVKCGEREGGQRMHDDDKQFIATYGLPAFKVSPEEAIRYSGAYVKVRGLDQAATDRAGGVKMYTCEVEARVCPLPRTDGPTWAGCSRFSFEPDKAGNRIAGDTITIPAGNIICADQDIEMS